MVDALVSGVLQQLATIVAKEVEQEVRLVVGVRKEVEKLSRTFTKIQSVLKDAEKKQFMGGSEMRNWLQDLKGVAYDIDDVLDEWNTAIIKAQLEQLRYGVDDDAHRISMSSTSKKVCPDNLFSLYCCFSLKQVGLRRDISHKIKKINERVDEIASLQEKFHFTHEIVSSGIFEKEPRSRLQTSAFIDASEVFGRDKDRDIIISKLLEEGSSSQQQQQLVVYPKTIPIISIIGMGGLGKTTLAQHVFNDERVKKFFDKRVWVDVGFKSFDWMSIASDIIKQIGSTKDSVNQGGDNNNSWQYMHDKLNESVNAKHFLLVLDNVWNEDSTKWDPIRRSLELGSQGSKIIITTRKLQVANMMGATYNHNLDILSEEACWSFLRRYALVGRQEEECKKLEEIGKKLAKKCKGLPLSVRTLAGALRSKRSRQEWQSVLDNDLWNAISTSDQILPSLLISYNELPSHLKQCFAYCSYIPRGDTLVKHDIILKWMGQGFLSGHTGDLFIVGEEYFDDLVLRSFFQKNVTMSKGKREHFTMHDLVYDFGKFLEEDACFSLKIRDTTRTEELSSRARHLFLVLKETSNIPPFIYKAKNLRTLDIRGSIPKISFELFCQLTCLRTLDLSGTGVEELPKEIEKLIHLRYLDLSEARFKELPKSVTSLYNLQTLWLYNCSNLRKLPEGIGGMINLVDLDLTECRELSYLPEGIGRLTKLRALSDFIIGGGGGGVERGGCKIAELKDLNFLHGTLSIIGLGRVENGSEAETACLKNKQHLRALYFYFDQFTGVARVDEEGIGDEEGEQEEEGEEVEGKEKEEEEVVNGREEGEDMLLSRRMEDVLEGLKPHPNIEKLSIRDYPGIVVPNWLGSPTECVNLLSNLVLLELQNCRKWKQLPSTLGKLPFLETFIIDGMDEVKFMGVEFFGINGVTTSEAKMVDTIAFPKLKVFQLSDMPNLEEWDVRLQLAEDNGKNKAAPGFIFMPCLHYLHLNGLPKLRSIPQHLTQATSLRKLFIWYCPNLTWMLPSSPSLSHLPPPPSCLPVDELILTLRKLVTWACPNLTWMLSSPSLSHLPTPPSFPHVEELILKEDAGSLSKSLLLFPKLKLLRVRVSPYSSLPQGLGQLTSLAVLDIQTCSNIKSIIPPGEEEGVLHRLPALRELKIMRCPALRQSCQKEIGEDWSKISHIPNIFIDGQKMK